ncbi:MAG: DegT/DnrJ/EryC1/StrS family aminotransferase [Candidatus Lokiarchaeota archaeon]|nr:DegT/DnrJ/EryC1/StrS family aminotransferase [Candidatus Lokiarchaeota archaeon]
MDKSNSKFPLWPQWDKEDVDIVTGVIKSGKWWAGSPANHCGEHFWEFQKEFAEFCEVKHAFAVTNGTHALEIALQALDIGLGNEVIVPDMTFFASASCVVSVNAVPIFAEIDRETFNIDDKKIETLITERTKAIITVHLGGMPAHMGRICEIAKKHDLFVIEDSAHAQGSRYMGKRMGTWGDIGTFSFQASKVLTSGEGGAVITNNDDLAHKIYSIIDCGRKEGKRSYDHFTYGSNYRLSELCCALLRSQLKKFPKQHAQRNRNAQYLRKRLNEIEGIMCQKREKHVQECANYVFPFVFEPDKFGNISKQQFYDYLNNNGIPTDDTYPPLHGLKCFKNIKLRKGIDYSSANWGGKKSDDVNFPVTSEVSSRLIELPQELLLSDQSQLDYVVETIKNLQQSFIS